MVFSKNSKVALLALALGTVNISSAFAIPGDEREADRAQGFTTRQIIRFIQGRGDHSLYGREANLMHAAYHHLTDEIARLEDDFEANWPSIAKTMLGLAELLQNHPTRSLPSMSSDQSARHVIGLLNEIIRSPEGVETKHVNYAKIYWGQLLVKRIGAQMTDEDKTNGWRHLSSIGNNYTRIGNVYRAHLLLKNDYIPEDVTYNEHGIPQVGAYAQNLLDGSFSDSRAKRTRRLEDLARDRRSADTRNTDNLAPNEVPEAERQAPAVTPQEIDVTPENLTEKDARELRATLVRAATRREIEDRQTPAISSEESSENVIPHLSIDDKSSLSSESDESTPASGTKRARAEFESESAEGDADLNPDQGFDFYSQAPASAANPRGRYLSDSSNGSAPYREKISLTDAQKVRFRELYLQFSGNQLYSKLRTDVLTPEQSNLLQTRYQFTDWVGRTRSRMEIDGQQLAPKHPAAVPLTDAQFGRITDYFSQRPVLIDKDFRAFLWPLLTDAQKQCFPEGQDSRKFKNYLRNKRDKITKIRNI